MGVRILFIVPYPLKRSPSQRFRFEQYFDELERNGFKYQVSPFLNAHNWLVFSKPGNYPQKMLAIAQGFFMRFVDLLRAPFFNFIFIHREAMPIGPPMFEFLLKFILRKKIIYDFDDAIWLTDKENEPLIEQVLKWRSKVKYICKWAHKISCSNEYLKRYASAFHEMVTYLPTTIDTELVHNPALYPPVTEKSCGITIGWTGSYSTLKYLKQVEGILTEIQQQYTEVNFLVICDRKPALLVPDWQFLEWDPETEVEDLLNIDIGIMPLPDDEWTKGKGGFKCLQYMALKIPAVASNVGENARIVEPWTNGFLANTSADWKDALLRLIGDKNLRETLGANGRKKVQQSYSVVSQAPLFVSLFK